MFTNRNFIIVFLLKITSMFCFVLFVGKIEALSLRGNPVLVTGCSSPVVRSFHASNGGLNWETRLPSSGPKNSDQKHFIDADGMRVISVYTSDENLVISDFSYASQKVSEMLIPQHFNHSTLFLFIQTIIHAFYVVQNTN